VEQAVTDAERDRWRRSNPETRARAEGAVEQLERAVAGLEADLAAARQRGDSRAEQQAQAALEARQQWLDAARRTAQEFSG
jgi:predicted  nucleic acid-binding Zn-ribbon protein